MLEKQSKNRGFTALEVMIVLVVGCSIIALSVSRMGGLFLNSNTTRAADTILGLYTSGRSLQGVGGRASGDLFTLLNETKMLPPGMTYDAATKVAKNEWNKPVQMEGSASGFTISYEGVPPEACLKLVQTLIPSGNFKDIKADATTLTSSSTVTDIATACKTTTTMVFTVEC